LSGWSHGKDLRYPHKVRKRAVRMVMDHRNPDTSESPGIASIAPMVGVHPETLGAWLRRSQVDAGERPGLTSAERDQLGQLRRATAISKSATRFFGAELDGRHTQ